jgi:hypothetical protein
MSIIRAVLRLCTVAALRENTWAGPRVTDSDATPLLDALQGGARPYLTVFTDDDVRTDLMGRDFYSANKVVSLAIESGIAEALVLQEGEPAELRIPQTSEAMELTLDLMELQIINALWVDPESPWRNMIQRMVNRIMRVPSMRGGSSDKGKRWAARSITFVCDCISDPVPGVPLPDGHPLIDFLNLCDTNPVAGMQLDVSADIIRAVYDPATPGADMWKQIEALLGTSAQAVKDIGLGPVMDQPSGHVHESTPVLTEVIADPVTPTIDLPLEDDLPDLNYQHYVPETEDE